MYKDKQNKHFDTHLIEQEVWSIARYNAKDIYSTVYRVRVRVRVMLERSC